ncbi:Transmembrane 19 [Chlorella sorokiniana]|uniref:Transmembrane 19 n=1 Tax=Chlorella sorokiniana TaxID=3076 RepID=A0A2P6TE24_CHLSO|nr:Transmembrane 19 [Chlorella sorokiniana]|eukprot:PRW20879.1 Transmembrane 19 [Chlorella sorokiniana]
MNPDVAEALKRVQAAMADAETNLQRIELLPSAQLPSRWGFLLRPAAQFAALFAVCAAVHSFGRAISVAGSIAVGLAAAGWGLRRDSLNVSGAMAALLLGAGTLAASCRGGLLLLAFFFASSKITQFGEEQKDVDEDHKKGGQRDWQQVFCNALVPTGIAIAAAWVSGGRTDAALGLALPGLDAAAQQLLTALNAALLGYYACCCGDTWSSELGQLSSEEPRLITTGRPVRKGTNGGVTLLGFGAALAGGLFMGLVFWLASLISPLGGAPAAALRRWQPVALGLAGGFVGSLIDSLLGATIQFTGYNRVTGKITGRPGPDVSPISGFPILDNNMVNAVSATATAALTGLAAAAVL